jgi:hypothetical protein
MCPLTAQVWNGNVNPDEARGGQFNYMAVSSDRVTWSAPIKAFSDILASSNPIACNSSCMQWQPNLVLLDKGQRLGCAWSQGWSQGSELDGCYADRTYWSVLDAPPSEGGKWENRVLTFDGGDFHKLLDGRRWQVFPTQNPTHLRNGKLVVPVTLIDNAVRTGLRRASVLLSDDEGATFSVSNGTYAPLPPGSTRAFDPQWETTVWEPTRCDVLALLLFSYVCQNSPHHW